MAYGFPTDCVPEMAWKGRRLDQPGAPVLRYFACVGFSS